MAAARSAEPRAILEESSAAESALSNETTALSRAPSHGARSAAGSRSSSGGTLNLMGTRGSVSGACWAAAAAGTAASSIRKAADIRAGRVNHAVQLSVGGGWNEYNGRKKPLQSVLRPGMRLLSRYLLARLAAPFAFALAALTGFMLLNQVARRFDQLAGKGLDWTVIGEVFLLCIPFILALTLPMAVLVAVLSAFSNLAADSEITAMRASGVSVPQILRPVLVWGLLMALFTFGFVDQVLPRSNARLRTLLFDISRKS